MQQYVKNGSRAIRGRVFPEYVCIEDVDKIISSVQRAPEEAASRGEPGKHLTASETRFTPIDRLTASARNGKRGRNTKPDGPSVTLYLRGPSLTLCSLQFDLDLSFSIFKTFFSSP